MKFLKTIVSVFIISAIVVGLIVPVNVSAAEVESLPAFSSDITVSYDGDGLLLKTPLYEQYMMFNQSLKIGDSYIESYKSDGTVSTINQPLKHSEYVNSGQYSYWYSESEARIYVMAALGERFNIVSYSDGYFLFGSASEAYYMAFSYYDLNTGMFNPIGMISGLDINYKIFYEYTDKDGVVKTLPIDMLCLYSSYLISGFYEPETSEVYTPDYYFKYQYLFYADGVGYTFVDSAHPLAGISNDDPTKAILKFEDVCNKHVYVSVNGTSWTELTSLSNMYSDTISLDYSYFYDAPAGIAVYTLVYTNDMDYDDPPLVTPEYGDLDDVVSDLWDIVYIGGGFEGTGNYQNGSTAGTGFSWAEWLFLNFFSADELDIEHLLGPDNEYYEYHGQTFYYLVKQMFYEMQNIRTVLNDEVDELTEVVHTDLQSVFDNISVTNTYLYDVKKLIKDMPDYTKDIRELKVAIENIDIQSPDVVIPDIDIPDYTQELEDIRVLLENLDVNISVPSDGNVMLDVPEFDDSDILHSLTGIQTSVNYISGLMTVNTVTDIFRDIFDEEEDDAEDVGEFITNAITIINANKLLTAAFEYMGTLSNGITWVNLNVQHIFDVSGALRGVLLLGVTLFCVNLIVRRNG